MAVYDLKFSDIPINEFESPYEWMLYVSLIALMPTNIKNRIEIIPQYKVEIENDKYIIDFCIMDTKNNLPIIAIECDGEKNHYETNDNYEHHCDRQNKIIFNNNFLLFRCGNKKIYYHNFEISKEIWDYVLKQLTDSELNINRLEETSGFVYQQNEKTDYKMDDIYNINSKKEVYTKFENLNFIAKVKLFFKLLKL